MFEAFVIVAALVVGAALCGVAEAIVAVIERSQDSQDDHG